LGTRPRPGLSPLANRVENTRQIRTSGFTLIGLGNIVSGVFTPVLAKHTKQISLGDVLSIGIDRIHRNFEPIQKQVGACFEL